MCSRIFYGVAEIRVRDDSRVKKGGKPNTGFMEEPD